MGACVTVILPHIVAAPLLGNWTKELAPRPTPRLTDALRTSILESSASESSSRSPSEPDSEPEVRDQVRQPTLRRLRTFRDLQDCDHWQSSQVDSTSSIGCAVQELKRYYDDWARANKDSFWQRKSRQTVLAVVVCRLSDGPFVTYRGMNTEVSLPCGSLCAERCAIATAATDFKAASDIEAIAVMDPNDNINPLWPCEVCQSWLAKLHDQNSAIKVIAVSSSACETFVVRVNGRLLPPVQKERRPPAAYVDKVILAPNVTERPWEAQDLVYVAPFGETITEEGRRLLKEARARGTHLLVGARTGTSNESAESSPQALQATVNAVLDNRYVCSVLQDPPHYLTDEMIDGFGIKTVVLNPALKDQESNVEAASARGILTVLPLKP